MSTNELVTSSLAEGLGHIVLNRPAAYNALNTTMGTGAP
jgi:enoyl-CoA hydratase/carnithine racemase